MLKTVIPQGYAPSLNLYDTQKAIGLLTVSYTHLGELAQALMEGCEERAEG